jgi:outer membrane lipoprotein-sorting protein
VLAAMPTSTFAAVTASDVLKRVKAAEAAVKDFKADFYITDANKGNISGMGEGYTDVLKLEKATVAWKKPDKIRYDGYARGIRATYIQNGYTKLVLAAMIKQKENLKNSPGKRQDSLDLSFLSSRLWTDNYVTVVSAAKDGMLKMKFVPKFGQNGKRHDTVWVDSKTLKVLKRERYLLGGDMRVRMTYSDFVMLRGKLPIATTCAMYDPNGRELGSVVLKNVKANVGLPDSLFSLSSR